MPSQDNLEQFEKLPPSLKNMLLSSDLPKTIEDALFLIKINEDKKEYYYNKIFDIVTDILLLKKYYKNFEIELKLQIPGLSQQQITIITNVINQKIFESVKNDLESIKQKEIINQQLNQLKQLKQKTPLNETNIPTITTNIPTSFIKESNQPTIISVSENQKSVSENQKKEAPLPIEEEKETVKEEIKIPPAELPEIPEIKIERPINQTQNLKKVEVPNVTPEEQEKIRNRLLEAISKKEIKHKITDTLKEVIQKGVKIEKAKPKKQTPVQISKEESSEIISGNEKLEPETGKNSSSNLFGINIKEEIIKPKDESLPKASEPIKYKQTKETNPFGEA